MIGKKRFISEGVIRSFLTPDSFRNGLGWMMDPESAFMKNGPAGSFGHTGFTGTSIAVVPEYRLSVIILINRQNVGLQPNGVYYNPNPIRQAVFESVMEWCKGETAQRRGVEGMERVEGIGRGGGGEIDR
jgi:CubicO group peptidase (beta-lactamase class C family)